MTSYILGLSAFYHDSAACLLRDGEIVAAAQEERFTRRKGDASFPRHAVDYCLTAGGIGVGDLTHVGFYDKPLLKFERILETYLGIAPRGFTSFLKAGPLWIKDKLYLGRQLQDDLGYDGDIFYAEHHESHAASAFFPSPFEEAAILTMDGVGEWATASIGEGSGGDIRILRELHWPDSIGLLYSAFTYYLGFKVNAGEYKVMGLAPYGEPKYVQLILDELVDLRDDGSLTLNQRYFDYLGGLTMTNGTFDRLFGGKPRVPETNLVQRDLDLARSIQEVCEQVMLRMARTAHRITGRSALCLAGGVALNCVGNGRILREGPFERLWIQPASGDAGGALGVAQLIWQRQAGGSRPRVAPGADAMKGAYLGPEFSPEEIRRTLDGLGAAYHLMEPEPLIERVAGLLADGSVVGWFSGRMEFGPRALGARSILGDPRNPEMQSQMNIKIKFREGFRPFAPSVLRERASEWFELESDSPYMLLVAPVRPERRCPTSPDEEARWGIEKLKVRRSDIPAVTHVDYSARIQTVHRETNARYYDLIRAFDRRTGCPVLVNTSFNVRGEPIVCTPTDAYRCFMRTNIDYLVLWPYLLAKSEQPAWQEEGDWRKDVPLD
jgi:carbamoyltransferase